MTVVVAVKVADGVVLGADSMTHARRLDVLKTFRNAPKVFQLGELPAGAAFFGQGTILRRTVGGVVEDFVAAADLPPTLDDMAKALYRFVKQRYDDEFPTGGERPTLGVLIAGYSAGEKYAEGYEFELPRDRAVVQVWGRDTTYGEAVWRGVTGALTRLFRGFDPRIQARLNREGLAGDAIARVLRDLDSPISTWGMPLQDAVDYARFMLDTTIGVSELEPDPSPCSHPLQLAVITRSGQFRWLGEVGLD